MTRIMFVCHGNICRSPMAEFIFNHMVKKAGLEHRFLAGSSATSTEEILCGVGNPVYPPALEQLQKNNIPVKARRAVQLKKQDYPDYQLFLAMDRNNLRNIMRIFGADPQGKVHLLMDYTGTPKDVADPWYTGKFDTAYKDITEGCAALLKKLTEKPENL